MSSMRKEMFIKYVSYFYKYLNNTHIILYYLLTSTTYLLNTWHFLLHV